MIRTLVVDDDYRVADINAAYVAKVEGFEVMAQVHTAGDAYQTVESKRPDLLLLDLYLPDAHGLDLMRRLQTIPGPRPDVIVITAARDAESVRSAIQLGALHYLVKPFTFDRLADRLTGYRQLRASLAKLGEASQEDVDQLYALVRTPTPPKLPKGQSLPTMTQILAVVRSSPAALDAVDIAERVGISRPTAQRYLTQLVESGLVELSLRYGVAGRPSHRYRARQ
jgi:response regulator of citrate/malate metabolism